ncbi:hypothetical protein [Avibacterium paragallinarum]|uniref:hypothetical protein n=1 Tax=Avibacterium paragallinarum TaxID=728 RepID=UPI00397E14B8
MKSDNQTRKLTRIKNEIKKIAKHQIEHHDNSDIVLAIQKGEKSLERTFIEFDIEFKNTYNLADMLDLLSSTYINLAEFVMEKNSVNYNHMLNDFFIGVMTDIASLKFTEHQHGSVFDTDVCLNILFAMTYCSEDIQRDLIAKLSMMRAFKEEKNEPVRFFSTYTLLPMVKFFYELKHPEIEFPLNISNIADKKGNLIFDKNNHRIHPLFKKVLDNYNTENEETFKNLIDELCEYHLKRSKNDYFLEFNNLCWQYFPVEILFLLKERRSLGYSLNEIHHPLIDDFLPYFLNDFEISVQNKQILELVLEK